MTRKVKSSTLTAMKCLLTLLLFVTSPIVLAASDAYRVEVIVFRHLQATPEPRQPIELRSFSHFPNLEESKQAGTTGELYRRDLPDDLRVVTEKSGKMDATWRRLRSSKGYRPLVYAAWEQNRIDYYPPMRIHDQNVLDTRFEAPGNILFADLAASDPLAAYRSHFYKIDGSLQLRRSRFLHLYLDLELREEASRIIDTDSDQAMTSDSFLGTPDKQFLTDSNADETGGYGVYLIQQNRQVSTGEMQYFDTPYFGALVYVTNISGN